MFYGEKIKYSILKEIEKGDSIPKYTGYGISKEEFGEIVELIIGDELIKDGEVNRMGIGNKIQYIFLTKARLTSKGYQYLKENSALAKTYKGLKEVRNVYDILKVVLPYNRLLMS